MRPAPAAATLRHIDRAIARLDNGPYGWCIWCLRRIERVRLQVMPFAVRCRDCEMAREAGLEPS
jgi:DnaK suppressor protein